VTNGRIVADLRDFTLAPGNEPPPAGRLDFSSVAFRSDGDRFFATLTTSARSYLVTGSIAARSLAVARTDVASEALSPDGKRLIVKKRESGSWQLFVLDLDTLTEQALNQGPGSVDDQVEWLDNAHVVYHDATENGTGIWSLAIDGVTTPRLLVADAYSPSVQQ
jgi:Tol biopolymer transport system component